MIDGAGEHDGGDVTGASDDGPPHCTINVVIGADAAHVAVSGEVDLAVAGELDACLRDALAQRSLVLVDLSTVTFLDSTGINVLVRCSRDAVEAGTRLVVAQRSPNVERLFEIAGVSAWLEVGDATHDDA